MDELLRAAQDDEVPGAAAAAAVGAAAAADTRERAMTVDLLTHDDATLQISVVNYVPKDGVMLYAVETNTTLAHFSKKSMKVQRKFEDFQWLYERFSENPDLAGNIIPHLPVTATRDQDKQMAQALASANADVASRVKEDMRKRLGQLQKFLRRVTQVPHLRTDTNLQAFLEYDELAPRKSQGWFNFSSTANPKIDTDEAFQKLRNTNAEHQKNTANCLASFGRFSKTAHVITDALGALPEPIKAVKDLDTDREWTAPLAVFGDAFKAAKARNTARVSSVDEILGELLGDYTGLYGAVSAMHNRRLLLLQRSMTAKETRIKAEKKAVGNAAKGEEVKLLVQAEESAADTFSKASSAASIEVVRCRNMRVADFRHALSALAEKEIENAQVEIAAWTEVLQQLKA